MPAPDRKRVSLPWTLRALTSFVLLGFLALLAIPQVPEDATFEDPQVEIDSAGSDVAPGLWAPDSAHTEPRDDRTPAEATIGRAASESPLRGDFVTVRDYGTKAPVPGAEVLCVDMGRWDHERWSAIVAEHRTPDRPLSHEETRRLKAETFGAILITDADGRIRLPKPTLRSHHVSLELTCEHEGERGRKYVNRVVRDPAQLETEEHTLWLESSTQLRVRVVRTNGDPIRAGLQLRFGPGILGRMGAMTADDGRAEFAIREGLFDRARLRTWRLQALPETDSRVERPIDPRNLPSSEVRLIVPDFGSIRLRCRASRKDPLLAKASFVVSSVAGNARFGKCFLHSQGFVRGVPLGQRFRVQGRYEDGREMQPLEFAGPVRAGQTIEVELFPAASGEQLLYFQLCGPNGEFLRNTHVTRIRFLDARGEALPYEGKSTFRTYDFKVLVPAALRERARHIEFVARRSQHAAPQMARSADLRTLPEYSGEERIRVPISPLSKLLTVRVEGLPEIPQRTDWHLDASALRVTLADEPSRTIPFLFVCFERPDQFEVFGELPKQTPMLVTLQEPGLTVPVPCRAGDENVLLPLRSPGKLPERASFWLTFAGNDLGTTRLRVRLLDHTGPVRAWRPVKDAYSHTFVNLPFGRYRVEFAAPGSSAILHDIADIEVPSYWHEDPRYSHLDVARQLVEHRLEITHDGKPFSGKVRVRLRDRSHPRPETLERRGPLLRLFTRASEYEATLEAPGFAPVRLAPLTSQAVQLRPAQRSK